MISNYPLAVLWDMDGTLIDTEPYWFQAQAELLGRYGLSWTQAQAVELIGSALPSSAQFFQRLGVPLGTQELIDELLGAVADQTRAQTPWRPGARELLSELNELGVPCALVTMSQGALAQVMLEQLPSNAFDTVVTGEMVHHGKPHPEAYLRAASQLIEMHGLADDAMDSMVAIEDSVPGTESALAAGLCTLGVPNMVPLRAREPLVLWESLAGRSARELGALVSHRSKLYSR